MNEGFKVWGFIAVMAMLIGLVAIGAWGPLAFIAVGVPLVAWAERQISFQPTVGRY